MAIPTAFLNRGSPFDSGWDHVLVSSVFTCAVGLFEILGSPEGGGTKPQKPSTTAFQV